MGTTVGNRKGAAVIAYGLVTALALFATACSGSGSSADKGGADEKATEADQALEHRKCLREQGLDVPEPKPGQDQRGIAVGGDGVSQEQIEKAFKACRGKGGAAGTGEITQADKDKALKFARCMRDNGIDFPDPTFDNKPVKAMPVPKGAEKEKWDKANKECEGTMR
ncbi:hypothetical protein [Streptomyces sp. NPDC000410]|uniref:hypothetical protein n=1 Tax=Streptomyces sp. NPDC000410 TaxID=3154254 RepID=UPI003324F817